MNILERMSLRKRVLESKKEESKIKNFERKYRETGDKKYLHFLSGLGQDVDYQGSDMGGEPRILTE